MEKPEALTLDSPVTALKNVGAKRAALYEKLGVRTVYDLLRFYPRSYIDYTSPVMAADAPEGENCVIKAVVTRRMQPAPCRIFLPYLQIRFYLHTAHPVQRHRVKFPYRAVVGRRIPGSHNHPAFRQAMASESFILQKLQHGGHQRF